MSHAGVFHRTPSSALPRDGETLVFCDHDHADRLVLARRRLLDRVLARLFGPTLDRRLAAGDPPESARTLAARASYLTSTPARAALARDWELLLFEANHVHPHPAKVPFRRNRVRRAETEVSALVGRLIAPAPVAARGIAAAQLLLTDSTGPVYSRLSTEGLQDRLQQVIAWLDPERSLFGLS